MRKRRFALLAALFAGLVGLELAHSHDGHGAGLYGSHAHIECGACLRTQTPPLTSPDAPSPAPAAQGLLIAAEGSIALGNSFTAPFGRGPPATLL